MATLNEVIVHLNNSVQTLVLFDTKDVQSQQLYLLRKTHDVQYQDDHFLGLVGASFLIENDSSLFIPSLHLNSVPLHLDRIEKPDFKFHVGENHIIRYLKSQGHWEQGMDFSHRWDNAIGLVDLIYDCRIFPKKNP